MSKSNPAVGIIMGSDSDLPVMSEAAKFLDEYNISYELTIVSAHRTPIRMFEYAQEAAKRGLQVIIAGAGGAAHLPGMTASLTTLPVIGVPIKTKSMDGIDSLLSIAQMPSGIPVATVAINGAKNAGILALKILALQDSTLAQQVETYMVGMGEAVKDKATEIETNGWKEFLEKKDK